MPTLRANNYETHYEVDDFTDPWKPAETVWIQHGFGRSSRFWYHWVPALARHYKVVRRDMRGHGQSADPGPDYQWSVDDLLNDIKDLSTAWDWRKCTMSENRLAGILGVAFAVRWPERFRSMTLCATPIAIRVRPRFARCIARSIARSIS